MNTKLIASALLLSLPLTLAACNKKPDETPADSTATTSPAQSSSVEADLANVALPDEQAPLESDTATATADAPAMTDMPAVHDENHPATTN